jgi:hypothetical protein
MVTFPAELYQQRETPVVPAVEWFEAIIDACPIAAGNRFRASEAYDIMKRYYSENHAVENESIAQAVAIGNTEGHVVGNEGIVQAPASETHIDENNTEGHVVENEGITQAPAYETHIDENNTEGNVVENEGIAQADNAAPSEVQSVTDAEEPNLFDIICNPDCFMMDGRKIRKTTEIPPRVAVYDLIAAVTDDSANVARTVRTLLKNHPVIKSNLTPFPFPHTPGGPTPVTDARGVVTIINLLSGARAARFRAASADIMVRYLGGDPTLVADIQRNAAAQQSVSEENIARMFGQDVEAHGSAAIVPFQDPVVAPPREVLVKSIMSGADSLPEPPPDEPGLYFSIVSDPDTDRIVVQGDVPTGKEVLGYGYSAKSIRARISDQHKETGSYDMLDYILSPNPFALETQLKLFLKYNKNIVQLNMTCKNKNGKQNNKTEFFAADQNDYSMIFEYILKFAQAQQSFTENRRDEIKLRRLELKTDVRKQELQNDARRLELQAAIIEKVHDDIDTENLASLLAIFSV